MKAVRFIKRLQWDLPGTVCRHGLTIGDVDNDGDNELVIGTTEGELHIFKGSELWQKITGLGLVTSVAIGDIFNYGCNALVVICGDGWAHIFYSPRPANSTATASNSANLQSGKEVISLDNLKISSGQGTVDIGTDMSTSIVTDHIDSTNEVNELSGKMECVHVQRIPTNTKIVLIADIDKDGANEMVIGLTDRVVRSYRWSCNADLGTGKLVGLNKWECTDQIGTVTLQHSGDGVPTLLVAQPGGTFMRIKCNPDNSHFEEHNTLDVNGEAAASCIDYQTLGISRMRNPNISTEIMGDLELGGKPIVPSTDRDISRDGSKVSIYTLDDDSIGQISSVTELESAECTRQFSHSEKKKFALDATDHLRKGQYSHGANIVTSIFYSKLDSTESDQVDGNLVGGNVILGEFDSKEEKKSVLSMYNDFSHNNNNNNNDFATKDKVNILGNSEKSTSNGKPYALATLDGTIMLVQNEIIMWAMQVDHQIFALCRLDVTGDGKDEIVACAWDGQTYILDQQKNSVRFQFGESVRAFCTGKYSVTQGNSTPSLVYNTFTNKIFLYYDVILPHMVITPMDPIDELDPDERQVLEEMLDSSNEGEKREKLRQLTEWLLYGQRD
ncbi:KICSTOR complex protein ITFG2-like isoform X1 [Orussus abietinus]|uniref:KICSTOR complex protein ITFG2-like isoform X1 n=1 Tax=Orussus abietinus TaxID=222816 RepID=UPI00062557A8|nr:KICSTOR complex protein ITFG2-like isoform X1 [Orussus abietinus]